MEDDVIRVVMSSQLREKRRRDCLYQRSRGKKAGKHMLGRFRAQSDDDGGRFFAIIFLSLILLLARHGAPLAERTIMILALSSDSLSLYRGLFEIWLKEHALCISCLVLLSAAGLSYYL